MVITSYGASTTRPKFFSVVGSCFNATGGGVAGSNIAIVSLECYASSNDPGSSDYTAPIATSASSAPGTSSITFASALPATVLVGQAIFDIDSVNAAAADPNGVLTISTITNAGKTINLTGGVGSTNKLGVSISSVQTGSVHAGVAMLNLSASLNWVEGSTQTVSGTTTYDGDWVIHIVAGNQIELIGSTFSVNTGAVGFFAGVKSGDRIGFFNTGSGIRFGGGSAQYILMEDTKISFYNNNLFEINNTNYAGAGQNWTIRRNILTDSTNSQGILIGDPSVPATVLIEGNVIDHNGWLQTDNSNQNSATVSIWGGSNRVHNVYLHDICCNPLTMQKNIIANNSSDNQFRPGGTSYNNLFIRNSIGLSIGNILTTTSETYDVHAEASDIIFAIVQTTAPSLAGATTISGVDVPYQALLTFAGSVRPYNITTPGSITNLGTAVDGSTTTTGNKTTAVHIDTPLAANINSGDFISFRFPGPAWATDAGSVGGFKSTIGPNNIYSHTGTAAGSIGLGVFVESNNVGNPASVHDNWFDTFVQSMIDQPGDCTAGTYTTNHVSNTAGKTACVTTSAYTPVGTATVEAYDSSIGGPGTLAHFLAQARLNSKANWDIRYTANAANNYIRTNTNSGIPLQ